MAANLLGVVDFKAMMDNIAKQLDIIFAAYGDDATSATACYGAKLNLNRIVALTDPDDYDIEADLIDGLIATINAYTVLTEQVSKHTAFIAAVSQHLREDRNLNTWMEAELVRVHPNIKYVYTALRAINTFWPTASTMATFNITGATAGTLVPGTDIDNAVYVGAQVEIYTQSAITNEMSVIVSGHDFTGATVALPATTITALSNEHTAFPIGDTEDIIHHVTGIAVTGGTNAESFDIRSIVERTIALA